MYTHILEVIYSYSALVSSCLDLKLKSELKTDTQLYIVQNIFTPVRLRALGSKDNKLD